MFCWWLFVGCLALGNLALAACLGGACFTDGCVGGVGGYDWGSEEGVGLG